MRQKSNHDLREQIKQQKEKLNEKQAIIKSHYLAKEAQDAASSSEHQNQNDLDADFAVEASRMSMTKVRMGNHPSIK